MSLPPGTRFGPYRIDALLGAGGMGEVYRATDTRLPRPVAIKVLLASVSDDPSRRARFEREARTIGTLNHPHICTLFDIGEHDGRSFIVMELVEGDTLARRIERGALPLEDALRYGVEIAGALDRAHRQGIVHRDLKPANIMIAKTGVKLLDFGLAKYKPGAASSESLLPTRAADGTAEGSILGTLQYMSPEQLEAREADARSDIFAFGTVLYEMVTGRKAFTGASQASLIGAILRDHPAAMTSLQPLAPASLDRIVATCLQKDPEERWQSAGDVARELKWVADEARLSKSGVTAPAGVAGRATSAWPVLRPWWLIAAALALVVLSLATGWMLRRPPAPQGPWILTRLTTDAGLSDYPTLSPDGRLVAYSSDRSADGRLDLYVKQVAGGQPIQLTTDGAGNTMPDFSPDGSRVVFRSGRDGGGIYEVSALGGDARLVAQGGFNPKYSPDGSQVAYWVGAPSIAPAVPGSGTVWVARLSGGAPKQVGTHFTTARSPLWSPDGASLLVLGYTSKQAYEPSSIDWWLVPVSGGDAVRTGAHALLQRMGIRAARVSTGPRIAPRAELSPPLCWSRATGTVVFPAALGDADDLWEVPISASSGLASGPVTRLTTSASREVHVACTPSGTIAFTDLEARDDVWLLAAGLDSRSSDALQRITREPADREHASLSKTGQHVAFASNQSGWLNIWIKNLLTGRESIVADSPVLQRFPVLDATGTRVAYSSLEPEKRAIHVSTAGGVPQRVCDDCLRATDWSADGRSLLIFRGSPYEISTLDVASHRQTLILKHPTHHLLYGRFSPDGRWVSFTERSGETQSRIMVAPIDGPTPVPENAWIKIADGEQDDWANWSPDGRTLYFTSDRDGHSCLWGQRIADATRQPTGDPFPVLHLHGRVTYKRGGWSSAAGRIAIVLAEETGNIWMMSRPSSR